MWKDTFSFKDLPKINVYNSIFWGNTVDYTGLEGEQTKNFATQLFQLNNCIIDFNNTLMKIVDMTADTPDFYQHLKHVGTGEFTIINNNGLDGSNDTFGTESPFVDYAGNDYNIVASVNGGANPVIDAGTTYGITQYLTSADLAGMIRIDNIIDLGPYEYTTEVATAINPIKYVNKSYFDHVNEIVVIENDLQQNIIDVINLSGAVVSSSKINGNTYQLKGYKPGLYLVRINNSEILKVVLR